MAAGHLGTHHPNAPLEISALKQLGDSCGENQWWVSRAQPALLLRMALPIRNVMPANTPDIIQTSKGITRAPTSAPLRSQSCQMEASNLPDTQMPSEHAATRPNSQTNLLRSVGAFDAPRTNGAKPRPTRTAKYAVSGFIALKNSEICCPNVRSDRPRGAPKGPEMASKQICQSRWAICNGYVTAITDITAIRKPIGPESRYIAAFNQFFPNFRSRPASNLNRNAFSLIKPSASFWS